MRFLLRKRLRNKNIIFNFAAVTLYCTFSYLCIVKI